MKEAAIMIREKYHRLTNWPRIQVGGLKKVDEGLPKAEIDFDDQTFIDSLGHFAGNQFHYWGEVRGAGSLSDWFEMPLRQTKDIIRNQEAVKALEKAEPVPAEKALQELSGKYYGWADFFHLFRINFDSGRIPIESFNRVFDGMLETLKFCGGVAGQTNSVYLRTMLETLGETALALDPLKAQIKANLDSRSVSAALTPVIDIVQHLEALSTLAGVLRASRINGVPWTFPAVVENEFPFMQINKGIHPLLDLQYRNSRGVVPQPVSIALGQSRDALPRALGTVITGPNEFGKTTILKMIALIALLGQMGGPVPAENVVLSPFANLLIFASWGNQDLAKGISGFSGENRQWQDRDLLGPETLLIYDEPNITTRYRQGRALTLSSWENLLLPSRTTWAMASHIEDGLEDFCVGHPEMQMLQVGSNFDKENPDKPKDFSLAPGVNHDEYTLAIAARHLPPEVIAGAKKYL